MDPSFSDPHHPPPPFTGFPPFTNSNSNPYSAPNHPFFAGAQPNSAQFYHAPPQPAPVPPPPPPQQSLTHPPYSDMICTAILALNEPEGSSKQAISRYIERFYTGIPPAHGALLTHHLKTLKNNGVLMMVKKSYKFAATTHPTSVSVAAAAQAAGLEPPRSDFTVNENPPFPDPAATSTPPTQKRGRGRPPKPKSEVQPISVHTNGNPTWDQNVSRTQEEVAQPQPQPQLQPQSQPQPPFRRPPGRPRKDGSSPTVKAASVSGGVETAKRRGRPPSGRAAGRERKPTVVSAPASVFPYVANGGVRRRGRPKRVDAGVSPLAPPPPPPNAESGGQVVAKRGRGRPPKIGGAIRKPMKPMRSYYARTGRPVGRPRKGSKGASGQQDTGYGELKKKFESFQEKAKEIVNVLKAEVGGSENPAVVQAIKELEELTVTKVETTTETAVEPTVEPQQHMEEVQPDEQHLETEPEPEPESVGQGEQAQTEAEAMQEALF